MVVVVVVVDKEPQLHVGDGPARRSVELFGGRGSEGMERWAGVVVKVVKSCSELLAGGV